MWDAEVPGPEVWKEALRILKPGGHLVAFFSTRTYHLGAIAIALAGVEIRDMLAWLHAQGMPKNGDVGKGFSKRGGNTKAYEKAYAGWSTTLKPGQEPLVLARKPLQQKSVFENVIRHGTGPLNIKGCEVVDPSCTTFGRWPANVCHDGSDEVEGVFAQFGNRPSGAKKEGACRVRFSSVYGNARKHSSYKDIPPTDGSASRFYFCGKASAKDRGKTNRHPTVKPLALMQWLVRLVTPPGGIVLDPFAGSGTTGMAASSEGFRSILMEREEAYVEIMKTRFTKEGIAFSMGAG